MIKIDVFDPPMCCSTGVCGPEVDPVLPRFAADLAWLQQQGVSVNRYNMSQQPAAFVAHAVVKKMLQAQGNDCLPLILANDAVISSGQYPEREALTAIIPGFTASPQTQTQTATDQKDKGCCSGTGCC